jgi:N-acetylglutamate synthase-like GNAT family acetyltransferase
VAAEAAPGQQIWLTTIGRRKDFYARGGFEEVALDEVPAAMRFEVAAGTVAARLLANDRLLAMKLR